MRCDFAVLLCLSALSNRNSPIMPLKPTLLPIAALLLLTFAAGARADVFELKTGGTIDGEIVDRGSKGEFVIQTPEGALVTFTKKQLQHVEQQDQMRLDYEARSRSMPDTVEAHRKLAELCKRAKLSKLADHHRRRILELDPTDQKARESLGYQNHHGRWLTRDEIMASRGLVLFKGTYRTPQDIALRQGTDNQKSLEAEWTQKLRLWRGWLKGRRSVEATQAIAEIRDPNATQALVDLLEKEKDPQVRELLIATLAELRHPLTVTTLVGFSLQDPDREVRLQCLDYLRKFHAPIRLTSYIKALKSKDNPIVNRAAEALYEFGDPIATSPLIDALVTTHKYAKTDVPPGQIGASFDPSGGRGGGGGGGGGLSLGGKSKFVKIDQQNLEVRQALVELSGGQDFGFDERAWRRWFVNLQTREFVDTRRDK